MLKDLFDQRDLKFVDSRTNTWGRTFSWDIVTGSTLSGHCFGYDFNVGDLVGIIQKDLTIPVYEITEFKRCSDPRDMAFWKAKYTNPITNKQHKQWILKKNEIGPKI